MDENTIPSHDQSCLCGRALSAEVCLGHQYESRHALGDFPWTAYWYERVGIEQRQNRPRLLDAVDQMFLKTLVCFPFQDFQLHLPTTRNYFRQAVFQSDPFLLPLAMRPEDLPEEPVSVHQEDKAMTGQYSCRHAEKKVNKESVLLIIIPIK